MIKFLSRISQHYIAFVFLAGLLCSLVGPALLPQKAAALSGNDFKAGRMIDDNIFFDGNTMDIPTIQTFLNSKVPSCDTNGSKIYSGSTTRAQYGSSRGYSAPYTCLRDVMTDVWGTSADQYCSAIGYGKFSAAGIISTVSHACNVSPKVLLVLLQKEQGLVTDEWPWSIQYDAATGYGCPDTASCNAQYKGLFNQIYQAARQYQRYYKQPTLFNFRSNTTRNVRYSPNASCGDGALNIENNATAGLYNYTPYQPNGAALGNLYGTGDGCSSYGNRNFWRMYNEWFGNTYGIPFSASFINNSSGPTVNSNTQGTMWFQFQNTGSNFWKDDTNALPYYPRTRLVATWPLNRGSDFYDPATWLSSSRPVSVFKNVYESDGSTLASDQHTVFPGQIATFEFKVNYPGNGYPGGWHKENFELVQDGISNWWVPGGYAWQSVYVADPFAAQIKGVSSEATVSAGHPTDTLWYTFQNTGAQFWKDDTSALPYYSRTRLVGTWPINRPSDFYDPSWLSSSRPVSNFTNVYESDGVTLSSDQHTVWPGQMAKFQFTVKNPGAGTPVGKYKENFELVQDGAANWWVPGGYAWQAINKQ
jgi:hypothetical protein